MKREILAAGILILLAGFSVWNLYYVKNMTAEISQTLTESYSYAEAGDWEQAAKLAQKAESLWLAEEEYTHVFIYHSELDLITNAFGDYYSEIYRQDAGGTAGALHKLLDHIEGLYELERVTIKNVF